ncbi:hypothetical protein D3C78_1141250 [compost metagenome]
MLSMNTGSGRAVSSSRANRICLPRFQVVIRVNRAMPASTGKAPPSKIFGTLAAKNRLSTNRKPSRMGIASQRGNFHSNSITVDTSRVSISMVVVTATP